MESLSSSQTQALQEILKLSLEIETSSFPGQDLSLENQRRLSTIKKILLSFVEQENFALKKLGEIPKHLDLPASNFKLQHFVNMMIPVERLLDRQLKDPDFYPPDSLDAKSLTTTRRDLFFILDNLRSAFNLGAIIRLSDSVGIRELALCGYTPEPDSPQVHKTSLAADRFVEYRRFLRAEEAIVHYQNLGVHVIALETSPKVPSLYEKPILGPTAFLLGNERFGLDFQILSKANEVRKIPMFGIKNSLNVGQAAAIAAFEWSRQNP